ncbi:hypothetical protein SAY86_021596 [Trapa natans]|uniref:Peptidase A1 domain-containing protein n=1 Tax=Trapa natans TaxID=22666 RepID=A0AAN7RD67_TRANT|nr:hypothetical protein SAY86_021596 [Trapa natans]
MGVDTIFLAALALAAVASFIFPTSVVFCGAALPPTVFRLQRAFPLPRHSLDLGAVRARDRLRHSRILQQSFVGGRGVVDFPVQGSADPLLLGLYFTKVQLGSPAREFNVQIDTGSDILWVTCSSCTNCPHTSGLGMKLNFFDASSSSTAYIVPCSDPMCNSQVQTSASQCSLQGDHCGYSFQYGDLSGTSGYYISDMLSFDMVLGQSMVTNSSAPVVFGCSSYQSGDLTKSDKAIDGIFGFGPGGLSVISQLHARGLTPKVFSHCLKGDANGGGLMVLGEILDPSIVYSPLVPSQPHYNLYLQSIALNGQLLPIDPQVFSSSNNRETIIDSGTTLAYLVEEALDPLIRSITAIVLQYVTPIISKGMNCYLVSASVSDIFPTMSFNFAGGASMVLKPDEYLLHLGFTQGASLWCLGFDKAKGGVMILGDLVLKDKIFVYDLSRQRIGWAPYDCSTSVNVSVISGKDEFINNGQLSVSSSTRDMFLQLLPALIIIQLLFYISSFSAFQLL